MAPYPAGPTLWLAWPPCLPIYYFAGLHHRVIYWHHHLCGEVVGFPCCLPSLATHTTLVSTFLPGHLAPHILLSHMCTVAQVKFNEGLQHNTCRTYHGKQGTFQTFCAPYHLTVFTSSEDMLMVFATYLDDNLHRCYAIIHHYMVAICVAHIALGLPSPLENHPHLQQLLWVICQ